MVDFVAQSDQEVYRKIKHLTISEIASNYN